MVNPMDLSGRVVLVTGASSGIGRETAALLSALGARVVLSGRNPETLTGALSQLEGEGHQIEPFDLQDSNQIPERVRAIATRVGPLSGIVHCAGVHSHRPLKVLDSKHFEDVQRVNVTAAIMLTKGFRQKGCCGLGSSVVLVSSVAGLVGQPGVAAYAASKSAVLGITRSLALELAPHIRVNCVAPAMVKTEMTEPFFRLLNLEQVAAIERAHPLGLGKPRDVANAIAFLLSDAARWITGSVLVVDGGYTAQ